MYTIQITFAVFAVLMMVGCNPSPDSGQSSTAEADESSSTGTTSKDPLAHRVHKVEGFTLATFDDWENSATPDEQGLAIRSHPRGRQDEFSLVVFIAPIGERDQATYLDSSPAEFARLIPGLLPRGPAQAATYGGDPARVVEYDVSAQAAAATSTTPGPRTARAAFLKKGDMAVVVFATGTEQGMREMGRSIDIVAQTVSFTESPMDPALVGTWRNAGSMSSGRGPGMMSLTWETTTTIRADGTFRELDTTIGSADIGTVSGDRGKRGRIVRRGENLTFHYEDGTVRSSDYAVNGQTLTLHGKRWTRQ
jgi:hypothetical protein